MEKKFRTLIVEKNVRSNEIWIKDAVWAFQECSLKIIRIKFWKFFIRYFFENEIRFAGVGGGAFLTRKNSRPARYIICSGTNTRLVLVTDLFGRNIFILF